MYTFGTFNTLISLSNTFNLNSALSLGGGVMTFEQVHNFKMFNTTFTNNYAKQHGGAIEFLQFIFF